MQRTLLTASNHSTGTEMAPSFNVVIAYEDFETGKHAKQTYDFLVNTLGDDCCFSNQMWKFDVLSIPKLREIALRDAQSADILMISCRGGGDLPDHVKEWLESWLSVPSDALAIVALFHCDEDEVFRTRLVRSYLKGIAKTAGLEFFAQPGEWPGIGTAEAPGSHGVVEQRTLNTIAGAVQRDFAIPRWGINE